MNLPPRESLKISGLLSKEETCKKNEQLFRHTRLFSNISNTCITKTISNFFMLPENIPKAIQQRHFFKGTVSRPFFAKNLKLVEFDKKSKKIKTSTSSHTTISSDFTQILKAKSTVIKQNKLQQFYINREGRRQAQQIISNSGLNFKSNLFKPNFCKKTTKIRRNSLYIEKTSTNSESLDIPLLRIPCENHKIQRKTITFSDIPATENQGRVLKEKEEEVNRPLNKIEINKRQMKNSDFPGKERCRKRQRWREKENTQFELQPWGNNGADDTFF